jgi:outer membrane biosynthesis protein TonB
VAYVPDAEHNKSASKIDVQVWMDHVLKTVGGGKVLTAQMPDPNPNPNPNPSPNPNPDPDPNPDPNPNPNPNPNPSPNPNPNTNPTPTPNQVLTAKKAATSPKGGHIVVACIPADPDKGQLPQP